MFNEKTTAKLKECNEKLRDHLNEVICNLEFFLVKLEKGLFFEVKPSEIEKMSEILRELAGALNEMQTAEYKRAEKILNSINW